MPELVPSSTTGASLDLRTFGSKSDEELDTLPFGLMELDREGTILRYNLAEARFARLDRADVLGKKFFEQIAPCTNTPEFRGRFVDLLRDGNPQASVRFTYVFDFRFGAQEVEIELIRSAVPDRVIVVINRRRFLPPRREVPSAQLAPLQRELSPSEERFGVQRDAAERRVVSVTPVFFDALALATDRGGPGAHTFLEQWGFAWGRRAAVDLETETLESFDKLLRELPMVTVAEVIAQYVRRQGWGQLTVDFAPSRLGVFLLRLERSAFAEACAPGSKVSRCGVLAGFFRSVFGHLAHRELVVREAECLALGAPQCTFIVGGENRTAAIDAALGAKGDVIAALVRGLSS